MIYKSYRKCRADQQKTISAILNKYAFFAFSNEQFKSGLQSLGLTDAAEDLRKLYRLPGGGFILKEHYQELKDAAEEAAAEIEHRAADPETGERFLYGAFLEELANHEYSYTGSTEDALEALQMDYSALTKRQRELLRKACEEVMKNSY